MKKVYITTAIPYVNGVPHVGHAMDYLLADVAARYFENSRLQAGTDEHGNKIFQKAKELNIPVEEYVDNNSKKFHRQHKLIVFFKIPYFYSMYYNLFHSLFVIKYQVFHYIGILSHLSSCKIRGDIDLLSF